MEETRRGRDLHQPLILPSKGGCSINYSLPSPRSLFGFWVKTEKATPVNNKTHGLGDQPFNVAKSKSGINGIPTIMGFQQCLR